MALEFDPDIAGMSLTEFEKNGLQVYRDYTKSFERHAIAKFHQALGKEAIDVSNLRELVAMIAREDVRFLPVIVCAFADDQLEQASKPSYRTAFPAEKKECSVAMEHSQTSLRGYNWRTRSMCYLATL